MYYLKKVWDELKQATWEKPGKAIRNTLIVILVMVLNYFNLLMNYIVLSYFG